MCSLWQEGGVWADFSGQDFIANHAHASIDFAAMQWVTLLRSLHAQQERRRRLLGFGARCTCRRRARTSAGSAGLG